MIDWHGAKGDWRRTIFQEENTMKRCLLLTFGLIAMLVCPLSAHAQAQQTKGKNCHMEQQCHWENFKKVCVNVKVCR